MKLLPDKTVERLSQYRRNLLISLSKGKTHIYSHEIAELLHITPVQVRRDIMLIGYTGTLRKGYDIKELIELIGKIIDTDDGLNVAITGIGNLGKAIVHYLVNKREKLNILAAFDINPEKVNHKFAGIPIYHIDQMEEVVKEKQIVIGIITTTAESAQDITQKYIESGVRGILNYSPRPVNVPEHIYLEEYDMITSLEKVAYFVKTHQQEITE